MQNCWEGWQWHDGIKYLQLPTEWDADETKSKEICVCCCHFFHSVFRFILDDDFDADVQHVPLLLHLFLPLRFSCHGIFMLNEWGKIEIGEKSEKLFFCAALYHVKLESSASVCVSKWEIYISQLPDSLKRAIRLWWAQSKLITWTHIIICAETERKMRCLN